MRLSTIVFLAIFPIAIRASWSSQQSIGPASTLTSVVPVVALDATGNGIAAWLAGTAIYGVHFTPNRTLGGAWGTAVVLNSPVPATSPSNPVIAIDSIGNGLVAWYDDSSEQVYASRFTTNATTNGSWASAAVVGTSNTYLAPAVALDNGGNGLLVWCDGATNVYANRFTAGVWTKRYVYA